MGIETAIAAIGLGLAAGGTALQVSSSRRQAQASAEAEGLRKKQLKLDSAQKQREIARRALMARSTALSNATAQGAEGGSGLQGGFAQVTGNAGSQFLYNQQSTKIGSQLFDTNAREAMAGGQAAFGSGLASLGGQIVNNAGTIKRLGTYYTQRP